MNTQTFEAPQATLVGARVDHMRLLRTGCSLLVAFLVLYPLAWLLIGSLQSSSRGSSATISAYLNVVQAPYFAEIVWNTTIMATGTTITSVFIGAPLAWIVTRTDTPMKSLLQLMSVVPFITPPVLAAISWSYLGSPNSGMINLVWQSLSGSTDPLVDIYSMTGLIWVMSLSLAPYVFIFTSIALENMDPALENASYIAGSGPVSTTLRVTLPLMAPAIISGALLVLIQSLEVFAIPATIGTPAGIYVFVTQIYQLIGDLPPNYSEAAALSLPLLIVCGLALAFQTRLLGKGRSYATVGGKAIRPQLIQLGGWRYVTLAYALAYILVSAVLPYLVFVYGALIKSSGMPPVMENLTLQNITDFFTGSSSSMIIRAISNSLVLSLSGATIAIAVAALVAYFVNRGRWWGKGTLDFIALIPVAVPGAVLSIGLLWAYLRPPFELYGTLTILLIAYVTRHLPFGVKSITTTIVQVSEELERAAVISGAHWSRMFRRVLIPILMPGLVSGWVLMFVSMMRELSASIMLFASNTETLAVALYLLWDEALFQHVSILSLVMICLTLVPIAAARWFGRWATARKEVL